MLRRLLVAAFVTACFCLSQTGTSMAHEGEGYVPTNEAYGECRARFPYDHFEQCNPPRLTYSFLMLYWLNDLARKEASEVTGCDDFRSQNQAQIWFDDWAEEFPEAAGRMDTNANGLACEVLLSKPISTPPPTQTPAQSPTPTPQPTATPSLPYQVATSEKDLEEIRDCGSFWDGSIRHLNEWIKTQLNDPDSFEHIETTFDPRKYSDGTFFVIVKFTAKNAFGGRILGTATAYVDPSTCRPTEAWIL